MREGAKEEGRAEERKSKGGREGTNWGRREGGEEGRNEGREKEGKVEK